MWWLIGSSSGVWGRGPGLESGISHNDPDALQDHCVYYRKSQGRGGNPPLRQKKKKKKNKLDTDPDAAKWKEYRIRHNDSIFCKKK